MKNVLSSKIIICLEKNKHCVFAEESETKLKTNCLKYNNKNVHKAPCIKRRHRTQ